MGRFDGPKFPGLGLSFCLLLVRTISHGGEQKDSCNPCVRRRRLLPRPQSVCSPPAPAPIQRPPPPAFVAFS